MRQWVDQRFKQFREQQFRRFISWCTHHRLLTLVSAGSLLFISLSLIISGTVKFNTDLQIQPNTVSLNVQFYEGTSKEQQIEFAQSINASIKQIQKQHPGLIKQHLYNQRTQRRSLFYYLELSEQGERELDNKQVIDLWKSLIGTNAQIESIRSSEDTEISNRGGGTDVQFMSFLLNAENVQELTSAIAEIKDVLQQMPELSDVSDDLPRKQFALNLTANASAKQLGMDDAYLQQQALQWFNDQQVIKFARGQQQAQFIIGVDDASKQALSFVDSIVITTPNEQRISLAQLTEQTQSISPGRIKLTNGRISAQISARIVDDSISSSRFSKQVSQQIIQPIANRYGIDTEYAGANESVEEIQQALSYAAPAAMLLIYLILAWLFQSWFWPLAVVAAVPFAMTGSIFGHVVLGADFTFLSVLGLFGVAGIVVNDSIILIDRFRQLLDEGQQKSQAIVEAACQRFRAVLLTSITTIIGLVPILFEQSIEAQIIKTMAISLAFGLLYGTLVVLVITPALMTFAKQKHPVKK